MKGRPPKRDLYGSSAERYARQIPLDGFGESGQIRLSRSRVLVLGIGAVGSIAATYLARAGVGHIGIVDHDVVALNNLHRQLFYTEGDVSRPKADVLHERMSEGNRTLRVYPHAKRVDVELANALMSEFDVVIDALDNLPDKLIVNDAACRAGKPFVFAGVDQYVGQALTIDPTRGPCLRCLVGTVSAFTPVPRPVFAPISGILGCVQATEALKLLLAFADPLIGQLLVIDSRNWQTTILPICRREQCPSCGPECSIAACSLVQED
jgi:molybdopterin/thiamine biosynthesis adenylyltransferase